MATEVFETVEIRLLDETEVELRPLAISKLRKFTRLWSNHMTSIQDKLAAEAEREEADDDSSPNPAAEFNQADLTEAQFDTFIKMCALGLSSQLQGDKTDKKFLEYLEDVLDEKTVYKILDVTGSLKFGDSDDPNHQNPEILTPGSGNN